MAEQALRLVDEHGELTEHSCRHCAAKEHELSELTRKMRGLARELGELRRNREEEARQHQAWPTLLALWDYYRQLTGHTKARWTAERFWVALALWRAFGTGNIAAGIAGIAYDANRRELKNGKIEVYDSWELLLRNADTLERYIRRRPKDWTLPPQFAE